MLVCRANSRYLRGLQNAALLDVRNVGRYISCSYFTSTYDTLADVVMHKNDKPEQVSQQSVNSAHSYQSITQSDLM